MGQRIRLEKTLQSYFENQAMILGACLYCSPCQNLPTISTDDNHTHTSPKASIKSSGSFTLILWTFLPIPDFFLAFVILSANDNLFKQFIQAYLVAQTMVLKIIPGLASNPNAGSQQQPLKARFFKLYYKNSNIDCYYFCQ